MSEIKESVITYLDSELLRLIQIYANQNRLTTPLAIESALRQFFVSDDAIESMVGYEEANERLDVLDDRVLKIATTLQQQVCTIEKLELQIAELQEEIFNSTRLKEKSEEYLKS